MKHTQDKRRKNRCSMCKGIGHTKRTCDKKVHDFLLDKNTPHKSTHITVRTYGESKKSPYVINLKDEERARVWKDVESYTGKTAKKPARSTVNFSQLVAQANKQEGGSIPVATGTKLNKKTRIKTPASFKAGVEKKRNIGIALSSLRCNIISLCSSGTRRVQMVKEVGSNMVSRIKETEHVVEETVHHTMQSLVRWQRVAAATLCLFLIVSLSFPFLGYVQKVQATSESVVRASTDGFLSLQSSTIAALSANIDQAELDLTHALESFHTANSIVGQEHQVIQYVASLLPVIGGQVESRQHILQAGQHIALGNTYLIKGVGESKKEGIPFTDRLGSMRQHLRGAMPQYRQALEELVAVDESHVPVAYQQSFTEFKLLFATFIGDMEDLVELVDQFELVFGRDQFMRYMIVFQNNREIRPTGGFMGSFAIVDVQKGKILDVTVPKGGTYDVQGQLDTYVRPPTPLQFINKRWEFHDSNWWSDFPSSAKKMSWFYEHSRGVTVDGVIAVNASVLEKFLAIIGPISNDKYDVLLNADTALDTIQHEVEVDYDKEENAPKAIIADLLEQFIEVVTTADSLDIIQLFTAIHESAKEKDIQVYMKDERIQKTFSSFGWTGAIQQTLPSQDYLHVVNTNIGGGKSDAQIEQHIEHQAVVNSDGSVTVTVLVSRKHNGEAGVQFQGETNINYMRVYVPKGSTLVDAGGFTFPPEHAFRSPEEWYVDDPDIFLQSQDEEIHQETGTTVRKVLGKTEFANWVITLPGEETQAYFVYTLPFLVDLRNEQVEAAQVPWYKRVVQQHLADGVRYTFLAQKQSGVRSSLASTVIFPEEWQPVWGSNNDVLLAKNGARLTQDFTHDVVYGFVLEKHQPN
ncbi:MAG: DUF4012 domain-containing protein [Candidatus Magasanikbacteria bacterium]|nr:DUF4012 domain-containing protein [Candidatus Magasanikbacteria bacterium]